MILFEQTSGSSINIGDVAPTKYRANLEGALMLVYENECNYNAMMKSVGLSEMKYYINTGKALFLNEAGAFGGFIEKAKNFFKKVLEKIKALFKKFFMTISSYVSSDKAFVKKYEKDILRATNLDDFEFKGWNFDFEAIGKSEVESTVQDLCTGFGLDVLKDITDASVFNKDEKGRLIHAYAAGLGLKVKSDADDVNDIKECFRARLVGYGSPLDETEFRNYVYEEYYGDENKEKEILENINLRECITYIRDASANIKASQLLEKKATKAISDLIRKLEGVNKELAKVDDDERPNSNDTDVDRARKQGTSNARQIKIKYINWTIDIARSLSNDITTYCGIVCEALKDRNRQSKAICIKAVSYSNKKNAKNESAYYESSNNEFNDLFDFDIK